MDEMQLFYDLITINILSFIQVQQDGLQSYRATFGPRAIVCPCSLQMKRKGTEKKKPSIQCA